MPSIVTITLNPAVDISTSVERLAPERKLRCDAERRDPGGGGVNVARVVRRLGGDVLALYFVGGVIGRLLDEYMKSEGVPTLAIAIEGETRESFTVIEKISGEEFRFVLPGPSIEQDAFLRLLAAFEALEGKPRYLVCSGSLPPGAPEDAYAQLADAASRYSAKVALDASGPALAAAIAKGVYLVKPSVHELQSLAGHALADTEAVVAAAKTIVDNKGAEIVVVTMGARGAALITSAQTVLAEAIPVAVSTSVGAGDSFLGAMIYVLSSGGELIDAFRHGVAASAASLLAPGTQLCSREDVARLASAVRLHELRP